MSTATEIKGLLDVSGIFGPIRIGGMDDSPDALGTIYEYGGQTGSGQFGVQGVGYEKPAIQVSFRGAPNDYKDPMDKCLAAYSLLAKVQPGLVDGTEYLTIVPQQPPHSLGKDKNNRYEIVCNFYIEKVPS